MVSGSDVKFNPHAPPALITMFYACVYVCTAVRARGHVACTDSRHIDRTFFQVSPLNEAFRCLSKHRTYGKLIDLVLCGGLLDNAYMRLPGTNMLQENIRPSPELAITSYS